MAASVKMHALGLSRIKQVLPRIFGIRGTGAETVSDALAAGVEILFLGLVGAQLGQVRIKHGAAPFENCVRKRKRAGPIAEAQPLVIIDRRLESGLSCLLLPLRRLQQGIGSAICAPSTIDVDYH